MVSKKFSAMPLNYSSLLFRHLDRTSFVLAEGLDAGGGNVHLLTSYYALLQHFEGLLVPYLDREYLRKAEKYHNEMPAFDMTRGYLPDNMKFLDGCNKWLKLLVALAYKKKLLLTAPGSWEEGPANVGAMEEDEFAQPGASPEH